MAQYEESEVGALARDLARLRRRAARQKRSIGSRSDAWRNWSATMDEIVSLTERLIARSGDDREVLTAKFSAILWLRSMRVFSTGVTFDACVASAATSPCSLIASPKRGR